MVHSRGKTTKGSDRSLDNSNDSRLSAFSSGGGAEKVQFQKLGTSKILVVKKKNQQLNNSGGKAPSSRNQQLYPAPAGSMVFYQSKGARSISADGSYAPFVTNPAAPSIFLTNQSAIQTRNPALGESQYTQQSGAFSAGPLIHPVYHPQFAKAPPMP